MTNRPALAALLLAGCLDSTPPQLERACSDVEPDTVTVNLTGGLLDDPVDADLALVGTARHPQGLSIRTLSVAGVAAANDGVAFDHWSVVVPFAVLALNADGEAVATLPVVALDACGVTHEAEPVVVVVDPDPGVRVEALALALEIPGGLDHLPADPAVAARVRAVGNPEAAGATVTFDASLGDFNGADTAVLAGDGALDAEAVVFFSAEQAGSALITAAAGDRIASASVRVVGPPVLVPPELELTPGEQAGLVVLSEGEVVACRTGYAEDLVVSSGGQDLSAAPAAVDTDGDGNVDLRVSTSPDGGVPATLRVDCEDAWGQVGTAMVHLTP